MNDYISLKQLAGELNMDKSNARRYVLRLGVKPKKRRTADSRGQLTLTLSQVEAAVIRKNRADLGFSGNGAVINNDSGYFYIIRLVPELDPHRLKLGFALNVNDRLAQHRTAAPTAELVTSWPCKKTWESTIMDYLTAINCRHMLNEVFECGSVKSLVARGHRLFAIMPRTDLKIELSDHSPCTR